MSEIPTPWPSLTYEEKKDRIGPYSERLKGYFEQCLFTQASNPNNVLLAVSGKDDPNEAPRVLLMCLLQQIGAPHIHHDSGKSKAVEKDETITRDVRYREYPGKVISEVADICGASGNYITFSREVFVPTDHKES